MKDFAAFDCQRKLDKQLTLAIEGGKDAKRVEKRVQVLIDVDS